MMQRLLIPIGAGLVSAVTFVSAAVGHPGLGVLLLLIIPLPLLLAGLVQGWQSAFVAGLTASLIILLIADAVLAGAFALGFAAPPVLLSYLALLNRPGATPAETEWYPAGRLVLACAVTGGLLSSAFALGLGGTHAALEEQLGPTAEAFLKAQFEAAGAPIEAEKLPEFVGVAITMLPAMMAVVATGILLFNLWLAGCVTLAAGHLAPPWPDLALIDYPRGTPLALAFTTGAGLLEGFPGMAGVAFSGPLYLAYVLLGLAIIHYTTRGASWRGFALWTLYVGLLFVNPAILLVAIAGLVDTIRPLRRPPKQEGLGTGD